MKRTLEKYYEWQVIENQSLKHLFLYIKHEVLRMLKWRRVLRKKEGEYE